MDILSRVLHVALRFVIGAMFLAIVFVVYRGGALVIEHLEMGMTFQVCGIVILAIGAASIAHEIGKIFLDYRKDVK